MLPLDKQNFYREEYRRRGGGWQPSGAELEALIRQRITPRVRVLDLGCGRGGVLEKMWQSVRLAVGVDADMISLREHRAALPRVCGQGDELPFPSAAFDVVLAVWVLEHLPHPETTLAEVRRVLVPGGHFIFLTPNALHPLLWAGRVSRLVPAWQRRLVAILYGRAEADTFGVYYRANTPARLQELAGRCGFRSVSLHAIADPTYLAFNDLFFELSIRLESLLPVGWGIHLLGEWLADGM